MKELFVNYWWQLILVAIVSYFVGSINFAMLFSKLIKHKDIRQVGSKNAGTTNVFRVFGLRMGALTFVCDVLKGVAVCLACKFIFEYTGREIDFEYWAGLFAVLGHIFPIFYSLRGGKGVATSIGVCAVTQFMLMLYCVIPLFAIILIVDRVSVMSILFAVFMIVWHWVMLFDSVGLCSCVFLTCIFAIVILAHYENIWRILTGKEAKTGVRRKLLRLDKREERLQAQQANAEPQDGESSDNKKEDK